MYLWTIRQLIYRDDCFSSDVALLYNDKAVLENHHLSATFRLLKEDEYNVVSTLKAEEYR